MPWNRRSIKGSRDFNGTLKTLKGSCTLGGTKRQATVRITAPRLVSPVEHPRGVDGFILHEPDPASVGQDNHGHTGACYSG